jgi:hypothetical protein
VLRCRRRVDTLKPDLIPDSLPSDTRPVQDEWGLYDPEQAGFEAVLRRLSLDAGEADTSDRSDK